MIKLGDRECPNCGGELVIFDRVKRIVRYGGDNNKWIFLNRYKCKRCNKVHRELTNDILPYKQYSKTIIQGFKDYVFDSGDLYFEDYPCSLTIERWLKTQKTYTI